MNQVIHSTLALALSLGASSAVLDAQGTSLPLRLAVATTPSRATGDGTYDPAVAKQRITHAQELFQRGRVSSARRELERVIALQRANGVFASDAMWKLAELHQSENDPRRTARVLDQLATEAERFGDPQLQARSLLEATILFQKARMNDEALTCANRLKPLLGSRFVSPEFRAEVDRRLVR